MEEDGGPRVARAGRRAARNVNTWAEGTEAQPSAPAEQGFFGASAGDGMSEGPGLGMQAEASSEGPGASASEQRGPPPREPPSSSPAYEDRSPADPMADDGKKFVGISRRKAEQISRGDEESVRRNQKYDDKANVEAVLDIPELEEEGKEDLSRMVAEAPKVRTNRVQGMSELEDESHFKLPPSDDRDIDLSLLTAVLCSSEQVQEADAVWDPELIFTEVASAINSEREKAEGPSEAPDEQKPVAI